MDSPAIHTQPLPHLLVQTIHYLLEIFRVTILSYRKS
jgi:hypothetical protein